MTKIEKTINLMKEENTYRRFNDGDHKYDDFSEAIFEQDHSHKCPTYVHKTPPCQGSCPSGEDIRGWLQIVRGIEQPPEDMSMSEYAFRRSTSANPFPSQMGRVCPAPCQSGCNRNEVDDYVGINAVEQFIGDKAIKEGYTFDPAPRIFQECKYFGKQVIYLRDKSIHDGGSVYWNRDIKKPNIEPIVEAVKELHDTI